MTDRSDPNRKRESRPRALLTTGIPLRWPSSDSLNQVLDADWIEPEYEFTAIDETGRTIQRSVDFVASVPTSRDPLDERSVQLYLLTECKYCSPKEFIWLFMPDASPKTAHPFDHWRRTVARKDSTAIGPSPRNDPMRAGSDSWHLRTRY